MSRDRFGTYLLYGYELLLALALSLAVNLAIFARMFGSHPSFEFYGRLFIRLMYFFNATFHMQPPRALFGVDAAALALIVAWAVYIFLILQMTSQTRLEGAALRWLGGVIALFAAPAYLLSFSWWYFFIQRSTVVESLPDLIALKVQLAEVTMASCILLLCARHGMPRIALISLFAAHNTFWLFVLSATGHFSVSRVASSLCIPIVSLTVGVIWVLFLQPLLRASSEVGMKKSRLFWGGAIAFASMLSAFGLFLVRNQPSDIGF